MNAAEPRARTPAAGELLCACGGPLAAAGADALACAGCGKRVPVRNGVPRFVPDDQYAGNFGFEWTVHNRTQLDTSGGTTGSRSGDSDPARESEETFRKYTGLTPDDVRGKTVLDVGCGMGRFAEVVSRWGGKLTGVDLTRAVDSAAANLAGRPDVRLLQASLFELPFADGSFDYVYSLGVLHHTPDCRKAFDAITRLVKPGGRLCVWVYGHMGPWTVFSDFYRRATTRMPHRLLHALCWIAVPMYWFNCIPLIGWASRMVLPLSHHPRASWRWLDTFDWYSPEYQSRHTYPEIFDWFRAAGFEDLRLFGVPVSVTGRKPA